MNNRILAATAAVFVVVAGRADADETTVSMHLVTPQGIEKQIGTVAARDSRYGLMLTPQLSDLTPGVHGFHVHQSPDCGPVKKDGQPVAALAAGGHLDPLRRGKHEGPYGDGHLGDLPVLVVGPDGHATIPVLAPRLKVHDLAGHSLVIHAKGDNYSDQPEKTGGGGARVACGVVAP